jgi:hypothetical protein
MNSSVPLHLQSSGTFGHHIDFIPVKKTSDRVPEMKSSANKENSEKFFQLLHLLCCACIYCAVFDLQIV